ncbi:hypothetical protein ACFL6S_34055 [Candidatus Poribacteria bacterium]
MSLYAGMWHAEEVWRWKTALYKTDRGDSAKNMVVDRSCRYWMERAIQDAKGEAGLADYELRSWRGWHHHMTMTILAMLFLLELQLDWKPKSPNLTIQDVREILEVILPKRKMTPQEILKIIQQKHKARLSARRSKHRKYERKHRSLM